MIYWPAFTQVDDDVDDDLHSLFCSKVVAVTYKACGLLSPNRVASDFLPKHFSEGHEDFLDLQQGASLEPHTPLSLNAQRTEGEQVNLASDVVVQAPLPATASA